MALAAEMAVQLPHHPLQASLSNPLHQALVLRSISLMHPLQAVELLTSGLGALATEQQAQPKIQPTYTQPREQ